MAARKRFRDSYFYKIITRLVRRRISLIGLLLVLITIFFAIFGPLVMPYDPNEIDTKAILQAPNAYHLLGTDELGRDLFSRIIYGARISILVGVVAVVIAFALGTIFGLTAGYFGGKLI